MRDPLPTDIKLENGFVAAQSGNWHVVEETFSTTVEQSKDFLDKYCERLKASKSSIAEKAKAETLCKEHGIYTAFKLSGATKYGIGPRVVTEDSWKQICRNRNWESR